MGEVIVSNLKQRASKIHAANKKFGKAFVDWIGIVGPELKAAQEELAAHKAGFGDWVKEEFGWSKQHAHRLMDAHGVMKLTSPIGDLIPASESQCRELAKLPEEEIPTAWEKVIEAAGDKPVTAKLCKEVVDSHTWGKEGEEWEYEKVESVGGSEIKPLELRAKDASDMVEVASVVARLAASISKRLDAGYLLSDGYEESLKNAYGSLRRLDRNVLKGNK